MVHRGLLSYICEHPSLLRSSNNERLTGEAAVGLLGGGGGGKISV